MDKIKILFIIDVFYKMAGAEKNLFEVVTRLDKDKFQPTVACLQQGNLTAKLADNRIPNINLNISKIYSLSAIVKGLKLIYFIRSKKIDIVVTYHEGSDFFGGIVAWLAGVPLIISSRRDMGYRLKMRHIFFYRLINRIFDRIVTVSDAVKDRIFERENTPYHKLVTVHNGIDMAPYSKDNSAARVKKSLGIAEGAVVVGIIAALRKVKGHSYFFEAASMIVKVFPKTCFLVAGSADDAYYTKELEAIVQGLKLKDNVIFTGECKNITELLSVVDISVLSSLNEGFSNTILESMAAGKPVVATNSGGTPEAVVEGVTGFMVPPCDSLALSQAISKLIVDENLRHKMGIAGAQRARAHFEIKATITKLQNMYVRLLAGKQSKKAGMYNNNGSYISSFVTQLIKTALGAAYKYSGISFIVRKTSHSFKIFAYHRINDGKFDPLGMNISTKMFESHIRYIHDNCNAISLEAALKFRIAGKGYPENAVVLTFDDGYRDNYTAAFPLLKKYAVPATVFLSVEAIDNNGSLWYDAVVNSFKSTGKTVLDLRAINLSKYLLPTFQCKSDAAVSLAMMLKYVSKKERDEAVAYLVKASGMGSMDPDEDSSLLTWEMVKEMQNYGITFGSHGMTHSILTTMPAKEAEYEISESKKIIRERTGLDPKYFAYPNGHNADFNENIQELVCAKGYEAACSLIAERNNGNSPYSLNRYCVTSRMLSTFMGGFSDSKFEVEMEKERIKYLFSFKPARSLTHV